MEQLTAGSPTAADILRHKDALAGALTTALYAEMPHMAERYGSYGRAGCLEDMHHNLEHLASAVELEAPQRFAAYIRWVDDLLRARDVRTEELARSLELMRALLPERTAPDDRATLLACLDAALAELRE